MIIKKVRPIRESFMIVCNDEFSITISIFLSFNFSYGDKCSQI